MYAIIFIVGVVGNGLLIASVLLRKRSSVANVFLLNLAVSDLVSVLIHFDFFLVELTQQS